MTVVRWCLCANSKGKLMGVFPIKIMR